MLLRINNRLCRFRYDMQTALAQIVKQGIKLTAAGSLVCCFIREKELVYGYMITGYKLIENLQARLLPFVLDIRKVSVALKQSP